LWKANSRIVIHPKSLGCDTFFAHASNAVNIAYGYRCEQAVLPLALIERAEKPWLTSAVLTRRLFLAYLAAPPAVSSPLVRGFAPYDPHLPGVIGGFPLFGRLCPVQWFVKVPYASLSDRRLVVEVAERFLRRGGSLARRLSLEGCTVAVGETFPVLSP